MSKYKAQDIILYDSIENNERPSSESEEPFLPNALSGKPQPQPFWRRLLKRAWVTFAAVTILSLYSALLVAVTAKLIKRDSGASLSSFPSSSYIQYERREFREDEWPSKTTYFTEPNEEVDQNWHELFEHQNIRVPADLMRKWGRQDQGIQLPDGSYYGSPMVFHHLHCLKNVYQALHPEYYKLDKLTAKEKRRHDLHLGKQSNDKIEHCLHMLKEGVMCQGDTTLLTMKWNQLGRVPIANFSSPHQCVKWDRMMEWVKSRAFDAFADGVLMHPQFGPVFVDRQLVTD